MKTFITSLIAVATLVAVASPAAAFPHHRHHPVCHIVHHHKVCR